MNLGYIYATILGLIAYLTVIFASSNAAPFVSVVVLMVGIFIGLITYLDGLFVGIDGTVPVKKILEAIKKHNDIIADNFYKDRGVVLQKIDADIMMNVIETMIQKDHTVLVYHDSCLCKKSAEDDLRQAMIDAWYAVFGDITYCKVEKK